MKYVIKSAHKFYSFSGMTREEVIHDLIQHALAITGRNSDNWTRETEDEIWEMCSDWNRAHDESEEIFMCECDHDEEGNPTEFTCGFYIEDDYFIVNDQVKYN